MELFLFWTYVLCMNMDIWELRPGQEKEFSIRRCLKKNAFIPTPSSRVCTYQIFFSVMKHAGFEKLDLCNTKNVVSFSLICFLTLLS